MVNLKNISTFLLISLLLIFFSLSFTILVFPNALINTKSLRWVTHKINPLVKLDWDNLKLHITPIGFLNYSAELSGQGACINYLSNELCFENLKIVALIELFSEELFQLEHLLIEDKSVSVYLAESGSKQFSLDLRETMGRTRFYLSKLFRYYPEYIDIHLDKIKIIQNKKVTNLSVALTQKNFSVKANSEDFSLKLTCNILTNKNCKGNGQLDSATVKVNNSFEITPWPNLKMNSQVDLTILSSLKRLILSAKINNFQIKSEADSLSFWLKKVTITNKAIVNLFKVNKCGSDIKLSETQLPIVMDCNSISISPALGELLGKANLKLTLPKLIFDLSLALKIQNSIQLDNSANEIAALQIKGKNRFQKDSFWKFAIDSNFTINARSSSLFVTPQMLDWKVDILNFERIVKLLDSTKYALPAPFNTLRGKVSMFSSDQPLNYKRREFYSLPFRTTMRLNKEEKNQIVLDLEGVYSRNYGSENKQSLKILAEIDKFYLTLPKIDPIFGIPRLRTDKRIVKSKSPLKENMPGPPLDFKVQVQTKRPDSIRIYYYLINPYLGLNLNASIKKSMEFDLKLSEQIGTNLEYLRRTLAIKTLRLSKGAKQEQIPIDAKFLYQTMGYDISLNVIGNLKNPELVLESDPYLDRDNIISLLIYGRKLNDLSPFQKDSVSGTASAIADRTLGLFSIWAFASTPIESVSYDPINKVYSAQVALPGKINLSIGTDWEQVNSLRFKKHLKGPWVLVTSYFPGETDEEKGSVLLQREFNF